MLDELNNKYSQQKRITIEHGCIEKDKEDMCDYIRISVLDDVTLRILAGIPDTDAYWNRRTVFTRIGK